MYITNTLVMMRKMMSILFLVLVLLISLGLSQLTNVSEGMEAVEPGVEPGVEPTSEEEPEMEKSKCDAEVKDIKPDSKAEMVSENDVMLSDVVPMEGALTENMSNYR